MRTPLKNYIREKRERERERERKQDRPETVRNP
jgi:hypothetical protein